MGQTFRGDAGEGIAASCRQSISLDADKHVIAAATAANINPSRLIF